MGFLKPAARNVLRDHVTKRESGPTVEVTPDIASFSVSLRKELREIRHRKCCGTPPATGIEWMLEEGGKPKHLVTSLPGRSRFECAARLVKDSGSNATSSESTMQTPICMRKELSSSVSDRVMTFVYDFGHQYLGRVD